MNARKVLFVLAAIVVAVVAAIVAVSLFTIQKMATEKNRAKTQKARDARWTREQENAASGLIITPGGIVEPKQENDAPGESESTDEKKD